MAFLSSILKLRLPSRDGSDAADLANIIADLGEDVDAKVGHPSLTTAQILALTGDEKAAGRRVWDVTAQVEKVSNGTTWVEQASRQDVDAVGDVADSALTAANAALPKAGGTMSGRPVIHQASGYSQIVLRNADAAYWISTDPGASDALTVAVLNKDTLAYVETALAITKDGHVESASHVGGVVTGTTDLAGWLTVPLPASPTGRWAVTVSPVVGVSVPIVAAVRAVANTSATFAFWRTDTGAALFSTSVTCHYQAIAY